ncbi:MAG TPA: hypothetical protein VGM10_07745 [Actinocrinis sp.]|jgi:hypothetical protein
MMPTAAAPEEEAGELAAGAEEEEFVLGVLGLLLHAAVKARAAAPATAAPLIRARLRFML